MGGRGLAACGWARLAWAWSSAQQRRSVRQTEGASQEAPMQAGSCPSLLPHGRIERGCARCPLPSALHLTHLPPSLRFPASYCCRYTSVPFVPNPECNTRMAGFGLPPVPVTHMCAGELTGHMRSRGGVVAVLSVRFTERGLCGLRLTAQRPHTTCSGQARWRTPGERVGGQVSGQPTISGPSTCCTLAAHLPSPAQCWPLP